MTLISKVKKRFCVVLLFFWITTNYAQNNRLRVMVSSDFPPCPVTNSDPDDVQSMVRFLLYSNEFDVEGLIASAGTFNMVANKTNVLAVLDTYHQVEERLRTYDSNYPTTDYLRSITYQGMGNEGPISIQWGCDKQPWSEIIGSGRDSEGSNAIIAAADKPDPRPLYIGVWGGPREIAQAIWKVQNTRSQAELEAFISKLRVYLIACQDATHSWLMANFPELYIIESRSTYQGMFGVDNQAWAETHIINNHGPLCAIYPPKAIAGPGVIEGDTPSFLYLLSANRGINNPEDPTQPSWGGQYVKDGTTNHYIDGLGASTIRQWSNDFQEEFKARADRCISTTPSGNSTPVKKVLQFDLKTTQEEDVNITIVNSTGNVVKTLTGSTPSIGVDISDLPKGVYIVNIIGEQVNYSTKIIK